MRKGNLSVWACQACLGPGWRVLRVQRRPASKSGSKWAGLGIANLQVGNQTKAALQLPGMHCRTNSVPRGDLKVARVLAIDRGHNRFGAAITLTWTRSSWRWLVYGVSIRAYNTKQPARPKRLSNTERHARSPFCSLPQRWNPVVAGWDLSKSVCLRHQARKDVGVSPSARPTRARHQALMFQGYAVPRGDSLQDCCCTTCIIVVGQRKTRGSHVCQPWPCQDHCHNLFM